MLSILPQRIFFPILYSYYGYKRKTHSERAVLTGSGAGVLVLIYKADFRKSSFMLVIGHLKFLVNSAFTPLMALQRGLMNHIYDFRKLLIKSF
jgi:hypothetical protein